MLLQLVARFERRVLFFPLPDREVRVGSAPENDIVIPFPGVSRTHAFIHPHQGQLEIVDAGSTNGLLVDGKPLASSNLEPNRPVQLGQASLTLEAVPAREVELAVDFGRSAPERRRGAGGITEHGSSSGGKAPTSAVRLISGLDVACEKGGPGGRETLRFLPEARRILGATSLMLFETSGGRMGTIVGLTGPLPPDFSGCLAVAAQHQDDPKSPVSVPLGDGRALILLGSSSGDSAGIAVYFSPSPREIPGWKSELVTLLTSRLLPVKGEASPGDGEKRAVKEEFALKFPPEMVVGRAPSMVQLLEQMRTTVASGLDVLLTGETGTGKELFAKMIHSSGPSGKGPFVAINCAAIPSELLEAELFGVHKGAATGVEPRPGRFLQADGGTLLLDEVGELTAVLQAKLLRVVQEREILALGAAATRRINVRIVATTNRDLTSLAKEGYFRPDLYHRLRGLEFHIPPLRDRKEDIPELVFRFARQASTDYGRTIRGVSRAALDLLVRHDWPGNIRELGAEIRRAVLVCPDGEPLRAEQFGSVRWAVDKRAVEILAHLAEHPPDTGPVLIAPPESDVPHEGAALTLQAARDAAERTAIDRALRLAKGNKSLAARILGISRNGLAAKLESLGIDPVA
jgi:two-component system, NtrC family, response regulator HydG